MKASFFALLPFMTCTASAQSASPAPPVAVDWVRTHVRPLNAIESTASNDLVPLAQVIGRARVIGLGEAEHGVQEFFAFRNRFMRFAVESLGVTAIAAETGYNESLPVDDYVLGRGELTPTIVGAVFSWSTDVAYTANADLLRWIRSYNGRSTTRRQVRFYGIDLTGGRAGRFVEARRAIDDALAYVSTVDSGVGRDFRTHLVPVESHFTSSGYDSLTATQRDALTATIEDLASTFARRAAAWPGRTSSQAFARAYRSAIVARQLNANFRAAPGESNPQAQREAAMAENLKWALEQEGSAGRVLLYEANWHISKGPMASDRFGSSLGEYLHASLGTDYVTIASTYGEKQQTVPDSTSVAAVLSRACVDRCWLNLQHVPGSGAIADWFNTQRPIQGGRVDQLIATKAFDAVVFIKTVHEAL